MAKKQTGFEDKIIALYSRGMTLRDIKAMIEPHSKSYQFDDQRLSVSGCSCSARLKVSLLQISSSMLDPTPPQENTPIDAAPMREHFNSLKALVNGCATSVDLANAIQTTSCNSNGMGNTSMNADVNYEPNQLQAVINKHYDLIKAQRVFDAHFALPDEGFFREGLP